MFLSNYLNLSLNLRLSLSCGLSVFLVTGCAPHKQQAKGVQNRILVFSSKEDLPYVKPSIEAVFDRIVYTPEAERYFELDYKDPSDFENLKDYYNIVVVSLFSPVDTSGDVLAMSLLPKNQYEMAVQGKNQVFSTHDYYSRGQVLAILAARTDSDLSHSTVEKGPWLFDQFDAAFLSRMKSHVFKTMEQKKLSTELEGKYGWYMRIQHDYAVIQEKPEENFVWLGRSFPYRWVTVRWMEDPISKELDAQIVTELVHSLPEVFLKQIMFTNNYQRIDRIEINGTRAWRIEGLWEHRTDVKGGPFVSYVFYDEASDRLFHINCLIHYPGGKKVLLLRQMETMVRTFSTVAAERS
ncbi:MAG: DUF4837 family protein [Candidatus Neomarinimicrobiota bacterium]